MRYIENLKRISEVGTYINWDLKTDQNDEASLKDWIVQAWDSKSGELIIVFKDEGFLEEKDD